MGIRIFILFLERKRDYFLRNNVPNFLNSILLYLLFPKHWRNIHIYSIRSTHNTYMVALSLKLNTTIVTRVIDEHLEFPHLHIWYNGPSLFMKTKNNLWVSQMLGRKEIQSSLQSTDWFGSLFVVEPHHTYNAHRFNTFRVFTYMIVLPF